jgi:hypothetical protein
MGGSEDEEDSFKLTKTEMDNDTGEEQAEKAVEILFRDEAEGRPAVVLLDYEPTVGMGSPSSPPRRTLYLMHQHSSVMVLPRRQTDLGLRAPCLELHALDMREYLGYLAEHARDCPSLALQEIESLYEGDQIELLEHILDEAPQMMSSRAMMHLLGCALEASSRVFAHDLLARVEPHFLALARHPDGCRSLQMLIEKLGEEGLARVGRLLLPEF